MSERHAAEPVGLRHRVEAMLPFVPIAAAVESFWREPVHQTTDAWRAHLDINAVMLAASLMADGVPDGELTPRP